jgi:GNAT superfamily N-acetyltransferase
MGAPIFISLDEDVREELEAQARAQGIGLATLLRDLAARSARESQTARIRAATAELAAYIARTPEAKRFFEDAGTPDWDILASDAE